jgi:hypothetical protein
LIHLPRRRLFTVAINPDRVQGAQEVRPVLRLRTLGSEITNIPAALFEPFPEKEGVAPVRIAIGVSVTVRSEAHHMDPRTRGIGEM